MKESSTSSLKDQVESFSGLLEYERVCNANVNAKEIFQDQILKNLIFQAKCAKSFEFYHKGNHEGKIYNQNCTEAR